MLKRLLTLSLIVMASVVATATASHVMLVDPLTVPTGFLATHTQIDNIPLSSLARALLPGKADMLVQHVRLGPDQATGWHTHPGPAFVAVAAGTVTYEEDARHACQQTTYAAEHGFVDPGFGHVHRAIAGAAGADFYVVYLLPRGSASHVIPAAGPAVCTSPEFGRGGW